MTGRPSTDKPGAEKPNSDRAAQRQASAGRGRRSLAFTLAAIALGAMTLPGCANRRRITITSEPAGARVWVNDVEVGVTPAQTAFKFYGDYEVRLELDGYEPVTERRSAKAPLHEQPGIDLLAMMAPKRFSHEVAWDFTLAPSRENAEPVEALEAGLLERARDLRTQLPAQKGPGSVEPADEGAGD